MADRWDMLRTYVAPGKVMQLSTLDEDGAPYLNHLWFASAFEPDRLYFISRPNRAHCENIRRRPRVAGAILAMELDGLGQAVRGVTFTGTATELPTEGVDAEIAVYVERWPAAAGAIDPDRLAAGLTHHRLYEIRVAGWVLYDEETSDQILVSRSGPADPASIVDTVWRPRQPGGLRTTVAEWVEPSGRPEEDDQRAPNLRRWSRVRRARWRGCIRATAYRMYVLMRPRATPG